LPNKWDLHRVKVAADAETKALANGLSAPLAPNNGRRGDSEFVDAVWFDRNGHVGIRQLVPTNRSDQSLYGIGQQR
jgi:hypothetical protein